MKKIKCFVVLIAASMLLGINLVNASDDGVFQIVDEASLDECLEIESFCRLMKDLSIQSAKTITHDLILDLNGYSLVADSSLQLKSGFIYVERGSRLTINDSKGTGKISSGSNGNVWGGIQLIKDTVGTDVAELTINGGTIEGYYYGVTGNGTAHNTKITINDGIIKGLNQEDSVGIYHPQKGDLIINGGTISGGTGIEMRSGNLTVNNGTITGIAPNFLKMINKNGSTTNGVGIAIAQHTTQNPMNIVIYNGDIKGQYALYEWNPHENPTSVIDQISMHIYGGNFTGLAEGVHCVYSEDFTKFISGGNFNTSVTEYLTEDASVSEKIADNSTAVFNIQEEKKHNVFFPIMLIILAIGGLAFYLVQKNQKISVIKF